jgi:hypothetical protein
MGLVTLSLAMPAFAAPLEFGGTVEGRAGYATNPFLRVDEDAGSASLGARATGVVTAREATSVTSFTGSYERDEYLRRYSASDALRLELARQQTFSARLMGNASVFYNNSRNAFSNPISDIGIGGPVIIDPIDTTTIGARRETYGANGGLNYQLDARNRFGLSAFAQHSGYSSSNLSSFDQYGITGSYSRVFSERTTAGLSLTSSRTNSGNFGDTSTYQPNFTLTQRLNAAWVFDGSVGLIFQKTSVGGVSDSSKSVGFNGNLCGTYPRWSLCLSGNRSTSASGFGGLRTQTSVGINGNYKLDTRSSVGLRASTGTSDAKAVLIATPKQRYSSVDVDYDRDLSERIAVRLSAGYRSRKFSGVPEAHGFNALASLIVKLGRQQ